MRQTFDGAAFGRMICSAAASIELHIVVENGVNIATVCRSIMGEVKYVVNLNTGVTVKAVNVCVDSVTV